MNGDAREAFRIGDLNGIVLSYLKTFPMLFDKG